MTRPQLFEIHNWSWCPKIVRNGLTDFLQTSTDLLDMFTLRMQKVRWQVLALTYPLPVIPLVTCIDGILFCFRSYTAKNLMSLAGGLDYEWVAGNEKGITCLAGIPMKRYPGAE